MPCPTYIRPLDHIILCIYIYKVNQSCIRFSSFFSSIFSKFLSRFSELFSGRVEFLFRLLISYFRKGKTPFLLKQRWRREDSSVFALKVFPSFSLLFFLLLLFLLPSRRFQSPKIRLNSYLSGGISMVASRKREQRCAQDVIWLLAFARCDICALFSLSALSRGNLVASPTSPAIIIFTKFVRRGSRIDVRKSPK